MSVFGTVNFVVSNLLALIRPGSVILSFVNGNVLQDLGCFIGQNAMALLLGGILGNLYMEEKKTGRHARDAIARLEDDVDDATEMICLLKEARKEEAEEKNLSLLREIDQRKNDEAALTQRNDDLNNEMKKKIEEYEEALIQKGMEVDNLKERLAEKDQECKRNREKLEELRSQASDNDFYCGYLEEKVKAHETERKKLKQVITKLEEKNHGNEAQRKLATLEDRVQLLQRENENLKQKLSEREREMASVNNSVVSENKNNALVEESPKVLRDKTPELADQSGIQQKGKEVEFKKVTGRLKLAEDSLESGTSTTEKKRKKKVRRRGRR
ncbi:tropomyosin-1-like [Macrobrachium rosenbergii]|uniref:tropomyosin-1-like n=1 Tax=Macrobrachium rosenbergii TaxID=79674 RepID=UPI0034D46478